MKLVVLVVLGMTLGTAAASSVAAVPPAEVERRSDALAGQLRCPVCQQLSVRDSPSRVAQTFRDRIRELVERGRSDEEVRDFFVARYGDWILLSPPRRGIGLAVWVMPPLVIGVGLLLVAAAVRRWTTRAARMVQAGAARPAAVADAEARVERLERQLDVEIGRR